MWIAMDFSHHCCLWETLDHFSLFAESTNVENVLDKWTNANGRFKYVFIPSDESFQQLQTGSLIQ